MISHEEISHEEISYKSYKSLFYKNSGLRPWIVRGLWIWTSAIAICLPPIIAVQAATPAKFVPPPLPSRGAPGGRVQGGASRGKCPVIARSLTALMPLLPQSYNKPGEMAVWGLTLRDRPTFWFYNPYPLTQDLPVEFVLQDEQGRYVYKTTFTKAGIPPGILRIQLPDSVKPLEVGKRYRWYFGVECDSLGPFVDGWIERVNPTMVLGRDGEKILSQVNTRTLAQLYAEKGIWYEALTVLADLRGQQPGDPALLADWTELLQSAGWAAIANEPLVDCCQVR